jgi:hypothetical protein
MTTTAAFVLFASGALAAGYVVVALFFLRFWRPYRDRLFVYFSAAFALLAVQRAALEWYERSGNDALWSYVLRFAAYLLILVGIADKNWKS